MPIKLSDLVNKSKQGSSQKPVESSPSKKSVFDMLAKAVASSDTSVNQAIVSPPETEEVTAEAGIRFNIKPKEKPKEIMAEEESAKEFQHEDQPDEFKEAAVKILKDNLEMLLNNISDKDIVGQAIPRIMAHLKKYDFLVDMMLPEEKGLMVRGLRESYGIVIAKKQAKVTKKKVQEKKYEEIEELIAGFDVDI